MPWTANAKEGMLGQVRGRIVQISLHNGAPGATGINEITGGGYARVATAPTDFTAASGSSFALVANEAFVGTASQAVTHAGIWATGPTFLGSGAITGDAAFNAEGDYLLTTATTFSIND